MKKIGLIGCGNMGQAIIEGMIASGNYQKENIIVSEVDSKRIESMKEKYGVVFTNNSIEVVKQSDIVILAIKPHTYFNVVHEIKDSIEQDQIIVTIAAGISIAQMESWFTYPTKVVRTMPNTPLMVGEGMTVISGNEEVTVEELELVKQIFQSAGKVEIIEEKYMDAIPAVSGSSPAYVYMFIEALADGAVLQGIPRNQAYKLASQAVLGAAKMVLETNEHPGKLKDQVCSPGGTTIEAVYALEKSGFRGAIIEAMNACTDKAISMQKK